MEAEAHRKQNARLGALGGEALGRRQAGLEMQAIARTYCSERDQATGITQSSGSASAQSSL